MSYGRSYIGLLGEDDELERRRRADQLGMLNASSPDAWIEQQANLNPAWMRRQPDMSFSVAEAEQAPDMTIGIDEAERRQLPRQPDMSFTVDEAENAPDMTISLEEAEAGNPYVNRSTPAVSASAQAQPSLYREEQFTQPDESPMPRGLGDLGNRWDAAEHGALDQSGLLGDDGYGIGEGLRDFIPLAAGLGLDIAFNKGRGVGRVAAGGMQAISDEESRRDRKKAARTNEAIAIRRARQAESDAGLREGDQALGWANLAERQATEARLAEMQRFNIDPRHPQALAMLAHAKQQTGVDMSGLSTKQQGQAMPLAGRVQDLTLAPEKARMVTLAEGDAKHELAPRAAEDAAMHGTVVEEGTRASKLRTGQAERDAKNPMLDDFGGPMLPQGIADDGRFAQLAQRDPEKAQRYSNTATDLAKLEALTSDLISVREAIDQIDIRNRTRNNQQFAELAGRWDELEGAYQAEVFAAQDRGAPQVYEDKRFVAQLGRPMTWEDAAGQPIEALRSALTNQRAQLEGRRSAIASRRSAFIANAFGPQGQSGGAAGGGGERLPTTTGGRSHLGRDTPDFPGGARRSGMSGPQPIKQGASQAVRQPDGTFEIDGETYTEDEVQRLIRKGLVAP